MENITISTEISELLAEIHKICSLSYDELTDETKNTIETSEKLGCNALVGDTTSTLHKCIVTPNEVRASGLLKDRIVLTYPEDPEKNNDMAVLQAATDEWLKKCAHWYQYSYEQHYAQVYPVFVVQVLAGSGKKISDTNLNDVIATIEERVGTPFKENEVVLI